MKKIMLMVLLFGVFAQSNAQEVMRSTLGVSGGTATLGEGEDAIIVQQSIGQASVIGTVQNSNLGIRQGFIQPPLEVKSIVVDETTLNANIFPNPVESTLTVSFNEEVEGEIDFVIYDMLGRLVYDRKVNAQQTMPIDMSSLSAAQYVLLITSGKKQFKANLIKR